MTLQMDSSAAYWAERAELAEAERDALLRVARADHEDAEYLWKLNMGDPDTYLSQAQSAMHRILTRHAALPAVLLAKVKGGEG